jgi:hypothetical protein
MVATAVLLAAPARAEVDTDFANQLHVYGIYGQRDYNAWLAKITCKRLGNGLDTSAEKSAEFLSHNLPRGTDTAQTWQFLAAAIETYCPEQQPVLATVAEPNR